MGFKRHSTLKCHTCPRKQPVGGAKKAGDINQAGWELVQLKPGQWVRYCPACSKRNAAVVQRQNVTLVR